MSWIDEIRERCDKAPDGPWKTGVYDGVIRPGGFLVCQNTYGAEREFIAHARQDIPYLLDEVARLQTELAQTKAVCRILEKANSDLRGDKPTTLGGTYINMQTYERDIAKLQAENEALREKYDKLNDFEQSQCAKLLADNGALCSDICECMKEYAYTCKFCKFGPYADECMKKPCDPEWRGIAPESEGQLG